MGLVPWEPKSEKVGAEWARSRRSRLRADGGPIRHQNPDQRCVRAWRWTLPSSSGVARDASGQSVGVDDPCPGQVRVASCAPWISS